MKVGFVTLLGRPNVGKSTLLNRILNYDLAITSPTPQTTRDQIKGIYNDDESQIVFLDTPGIHKPKQKLGESLNKTSFKSLEDIDLTLFLNPIDEKLGPGDNFILEKIDIKKSTALITKIDKSNFKEVEKRALELKELGFKDVIAVSVEISESVNQLVSYLKEILPEGTPYFDPEDISDISLRFMAKEIIRESIINETKDEVPHSIGIQIDEFKEEDIIKISASIHVERDSQKGIIIGANGKMIKKIGMQSRKKMEHLFGEKIYLDLRVKVNKNWTKKVQEIIKMGY